jgi:ketosteroid isomerase-like protein
MQRYIIAFICVFIPAIVFGKKVAMEKSELISIEHAFAEKVKTDGIKDGFLAFLDDSAVVFRPSPTNAKVVYGKMKPSTAQLAWEPELSEVAYSGDFGYTSGRWSLSTADTLPPAEFGHYLTIWKKTAGRWMVVLDHGIRHSNPDSGMVLPQYRIDKIPKQKSQKRGTDALNRSLIIADNVFATIAGKQGEVDAVRITAADDIRLLRNNTYPISGIDAARAWLSMHAQKQSWKLTKCEVASSGDIGYTYGEITFPAQNGKPTRNGYYIRIWRLNSEEAWKLAIDVSFDQ